jgi:hypothetical protein
MRHGGLDGVALQKEEYLALLNAHDMDGHVITGREETEYGPISEKGQVRAVVDRLDFYHPVSQLLFANQFTHGPEKDGVDTIPDEEWLPLFYEHKNAIREEIDAVLKAVPNNTPVFVYNLLSLRHAHPAAAVAIRELIEKYPHRGFLSHAADPDAERPEKISRIKEFVLDVITAKGTGDDYSGGPYQLNNLYHIVLNPTQMDNFLNRYGIPDDHVYEIPDFLGFKSRKAEIAGEPEPDFLDYLSRNTLVPSGHTYKYENRPVDGETVFFLSPVRPVYRKRLKEAMIVAQQYGRTRGHKVAFVVTHPNVDDRHYFDDALRFANDLGLQYIHLGEDFTLKTLDRVYENMAPLDTVGVVASSAGGWENALNEMAGTCIPFFMASCLNSFVPLTEKIGITTHGVDFEPMTESIAVNKACKLKDTDLSALPGMKNLHAWIDVALEADSRLALVKHNYEQAYRWLSHQATVLRLWEAVIKIYARHGLPGSPGDAVED